MLHALLDAVVLLVVERLVVEREHAGIEAAENDRIVDAVGDLLLWGRRCHDGRTALVVLGTDGTRGHCVHFYY